MWSNSFQDSESPTTKDRHPSESESCEVSHPAAPASGLESPWDRTDREQQRSQETRRGSRTSFQQVLVRAWKKPPEAGRESPGIGVQNGLEIVSIPIIKLENSIVH